MAASTPKPPISWNPIDAPIDYAYVAGKKTPGVCEIVGASLPRKWDEQKGYAFSGAFVIYTGDGLSHFSMRLKLYSKADWRAWWDFRPVIAKRPKPVIRGDQIYASVDALKIWHPFLDALGISAVVVEEELQPVLTDESGEWTIEIKLIQYRQPRFQAAKPMAAKAGPTPDPIEQQMLAKEAIATKLAQKLAGPP